MVYGLGSMVVTRAQSSQTRARRLAALAAIYETTSPRAGRRSMSLADALRALGDEDSPAARRSLRHALKHLLAADLSPQEHEVVLDCVPNGLLAEHAERTVHIDPGSIERFGPADLLSIRGRSAAEHGCLADGSRYVLRRFAPRSLAPGDVEVLWESSPTALYDAGSLVTLVTARAVVRRRLSDIATILNPVRWAISNPESFDDSYQVAQTRAGDPVFMPGEPDLPKPASPQPEATHGWRGIMYENYVMSNGLIDLFSFQNLLNIDFRTPWGNAPPPVEPGPGKPAPPYLTLEFDLRISLSSSLGLVKRGGGLDVDSGGALAIPWLEPDVAAPMMTAEQLHAYTQVWERLGPSLGSPSAGQESARPEDPDAVRTWYVEVTKSVRFTNTMPRVASGQIMGLGFFMDYNAPAIVSAWMGEVIREGICAPLHSSSDA